MILTLTPQGLADGRPLRLDRRGAVLGRAPDADIVLPAAAVSSRHCRVDWHDGAYILTDTSSNGTLRNGRPATAPERLGDGDWLEIGPYRIGVSLATAAEAGSPQLPRPMNLSSWNRGAEAPTPVPATPALAADQTARQPAAPPTSIPPVPPLPPGTDAASALLHAAGIARTTVAAADDVVLGIAGSLLRQLTAGVMTLLAARSQARAELGVAAALAVSNPLQRPASVETALAQLLAHPAAAERAVSDGLADLASHQRATLAAMQGALRATLDTLAPDAIRRRAGGSAKDAALWQAYEQAFAGHGSDASFIEVFAHELGTAYTSAAESRGIR